MKYLVLDDRDELPEAVVMTDNHFGATVVTTFDQEFVQEDSPLASLVAEMGPSTIRFPGGSATENYFDMTNPNSAVSPNPNSAPLTPMDQFFETAGEIDVDVALVIPTQVGFADKAVDALRDGIYGQRTALDPDYLSDVETFVRTAFAQAAANGVSITTLEIGNEFWGSGKMTASEYGYIAGHVAVVLEQVLIDLGLNDDVRIAAQSTAAASDIYAPRNDTTVFIDVVDGVEVLRSMAYVNKHFDGIVPAHYEEILVPGQGSGAGQLNALIAQLNAIPGAAAAIDGVVLHLYQRQGLDGVDGGRGFVFDQLRNFEDRLNRPADADPMSYHITEWNAATGNHDDNAGLRHASMLIETMFEMATHNVTDAQIWPLTFNNAQGTSMVDLNDERLSIAGEMYRMMTETLPDLTPIFDWSIEDDIDIHGFASASQAAFFVSERSGEAQENIRLFTGDTLENTRYVISMTELWDGGAGGDSAGAAPVLTDTNAYTGFASRVDFDLNSWANLRIEFTEVGWYDDTVHTHSGNDRIFTYGGRDRVFSEDGADYIHTGGGNDRIWAGAGNDMIIGSDGNDVMTGGNGRDVFVFSTGDGHDTIIDHRFGVDRLRIDDSEVYSFADFATIDGLETEFRDGSMFVYYGNGDSIELKDREINEADDDGGKVLGDSVADILIGGAGMDDLRGRNGADYLEDGAGRDFLRGGNGADKFVFVADGEEDRITDFQQGRDLIDITDWGVSSFSQLTFEVDYDNQGQWTGHGYIKFGDEVLRIDGMDEQMLAAFNNNDLVY